MKKRLFLMPLLAGMVLSGCSISLGGKTINIGGGKTNNTTNKSGDAVSELGDAVKTEFGDYKLATSVKDGGRYLLGVYRKNYDTMRFVNGDYHRDDNGFYPFYMGTTENTTVGAAEIEVKMIGDGKFTMQVFAAGQVWNKKYIGVYPASSSYGNNVMSVALLDSPDQASYKDPKTNKTFTSFTSTFQFFDYYNDSPAVAPGALYKHDGIDEDAVAKFLGTGHISEQSLEEGESDYVSVDCKSYEVALDTSSYDLAHFYEKK